MTEAKGYATQSPKDSLKPFSFSRRELREKDVFIEIQFCGICHSDLHQVRNDWNNSIYPMVPGHEIIGKVTKIGSAVTKFQVGDMVGVGCLVDSCRNCSSCKEGLEQFCEKGMSLTYNGYEQDGETFTYGGYSNCIVVDENYVLKVSHEGNMAKVAPLLCAGITTYSPLMHWKAGPGKKVGIMGLGGLGHVAIQIAHALEADVTVFTHSESKTADAKKFGADHVVVTKDPEILKDYEKQFDMVLNTVSADINLTPYLGLLKRDAPMILIGISGKPTEIIPGDLIFKRAILTGSLIGGIPETQEMLDFCAKHNITAKIEMISMSDINEAFDKLAKNDVQYRFVIDMSTI